VLPDADEEAAAADLVGGYLWYESTTAASGCSSRISVWRRSNRGRCSGAMASM
jgi:hypothetical protein